MDGDHRYRVFGLAISLPVPHAVLSTLDSNEPVDVTVRCGDVRERLDDEIANTTYAGSRSSLAVGESGDVLWVTPHGRYLISGGRQITVDLANATSHLPMRFVLFNCLTAAFCQRGGLPLHANVVLTPAGAVAIGGRSGAGKSTLCAVLMSRGCALVSDDVAAIRLDEHGGPIVEPGFPAYRLCADTLERVRPVATRVKALRDARNKYALIAPRHAFHEHAVALRAIYLGRIEGGEIRSTELAGLEKISGLKTASYAPLGIAPAQAMMSTIGGVARAVPVFELVRPASRWTAEELADVVLARRETRATVQR